MSPLFPRVVFSLAALAALAGTLVAAESGLDLKAMDPAVRPQDDLYRAMNGRWLEHTEIPADRSNYGSFTALDDLSNERIREIVEESAKSNAAPGSDARKIGDFYKSFMNTERIAALGLKPLQALLAQVDALQDTTQLPGSFGQLQRTGVSTPLAFYVGQDDGDSTHYLAGVYQSGLSLPDRDYYLSAEPRFAEAQAAFKQYAGQLLMLSGLTEAEAKRLAEQVLVLETALAKAQRTNVELRDPHANYNKTAVSELSKLESDFAWSGFFSSLGVTELQSLNVAQPEYVKALAALFASQPLEVWRAYLRVHLLDAYAIALPEPFELAHFEFHGKTLAGIPVQKPRWKKAVALISGEGAGDFGALGDCVGKLYVARYFPEEAKKRMDVLVGNLLEAYRTSIKELSWMSAETKEKASEKLSKYSVKIGYPTKWRDYSGLQVSEDTLIDNLLASASYEFARTLNKLGQPLDRSEWGMTPQTVNAYYNPGMNEIVFPAAILQPPFFDFEVDDAVNYGGIGAVIGHEISHGFDDQGCKFDGEGNLNNWWTEADAEAFKKLTNKLVAQYSAYEALPGGFLSGELTLGENIADLSGLSIAFKAYELSLKGKASPTIEGLSGEQRLFLGWSQVWRRKYREAELSKRLKTDPHSPSEFRANGPVINSDAFIKAFGVKQGDKLYKPETERIRIW